MHTIRVDGNDILAVLSAVREGRRLCIEEGRGVLIEAMTYRYAASDFIATQSSLSLTFAHSVGHHSTSDDSFAYRPRQEVEDRKRVDNPIARFRLFLESRGWWSSEDEDAYKEKVRKEVMTAFRRAENMQRHPLSEMFSDVYAGEEPWNLVRHSSHSCQFELILIAFDNRKSRGKNYESC